MTAALPPTPSETDAHVVVDVDGRPFGVWFQLGRPQWASLRRFDGGYGPMMPLHYGHPCDAYAAAGRAAETFVRSVVLHQVPA